MWSFLIFISIAVIFVLVSRRNMQNRANELTSNAKSFSEEIKRTYYLLDNESQTKFLNFLTQKERDYFNVLINSNEINYGKFVWSIQQHLITQQEIMNKLKKISSIKK